MIGTIEPPATAAFTLSGSLAATPIIETEAMRSALADPGVKSGDSRFGAYFFKHPEFGAFAFGGDTRIEIAVAADAARADIQAILDGMMAAALMLGRGDLPLHAATLVPPGGDAAIAFAGPSGIGKSTLAAIMSRRGWSLLADDVTRISIENGRPVAWPGAARLKLWSDMCDHLSIDVGPLEQVGRRAKFLVPTAAAPGPVPLRAVVILGNDPAHPGQFQAPALGDAFALLAANTYRVDLVSALQAECQHLESLAALVRYCAIFRYTRAGYWGPDELVTQFEKWVKTSLPSTGAHAKSEVEHEGNP
jgi:hypothetical protein